MRAPEVVRRALIAALAVASAPAQAAFFQIAEQSASGMGNAFAGGAAVAEDASTVWYNPAGMTRLARAQVVAGGSYIHPTFTADVKSEVKRIFNELAAAPIGGKTLRCSHAVGRPFSSVAALMYMAATA